MEFDIEKRTILRVLHGSHAYGTCIEGSDVDMKGVCIPPERYFYGYLKSFEQHESSNPVDLVIYSLRKFAKLAAECNPNIIEVLFVSDGDVLFQDAWGEVLRRNRRMFLSKKARHTFSGYAHSQLKRIKTHRNWLINPPKEEPKREKFGLSEARVLSKSEMGALVEGESKGVLQDVSPHVMDLLQKEKAYGHARREWEQYQRWCTNRNPKRAELERKHGYDTKHAGHLIRLMRMCKEILATGDVVVKRPDADELLAIRAGAWEYDRLIAESERLEEECQALYESSTVLPSRPPAERLDALIGDITKSYLARNP